MLTENRVRDLTFKDAGFIKDAKTHGLFVRIGATGEASYVWTRKVNGRPQRITLGKTKALRLADARAASEKLNGEVAMGLDIKKERAQRREKKITLEEAFKNFMGAQDHRPATKNDYNTLWRLHIPDGLKRKPIIEIDQNDVQRIQIKLSDQNKKRTANKVVTLLRTIFNYSGRRADNPAFLVKKFHEEVRTRRLNFTESQQFMDVLERRRGEFWADFIRLLLLTGARRSSLCTMQWIDLDLAAGMWTVPAKWSKNRRELAVPLIADATDILRRRQAITHGDWVWPSSVAKSGHIENPEKPLRRLLTEAGVAKASIHDLRRTLGSRLASRGASTAIISSVLGHVSAQSAKAYAHLDLVTARSAVEEAYKNG